MNIPIINSLLSYLQGDGAVILPEMELLLFGLGAMLHKAGCARPDQTSADSVGSKKGDHLSRATAPEPAGHS